MRISDWSSDVCSSDLLWIAAGDQDLGCHGAVDRAGVEVGAAQRLGEAPGQRALAGGHRPVDGDNHLDPWGAAKSAPRPCIRGAKSGNEVATGVMSSISTGFSAASPHTRKLMAMRWSSSVWIDRKSVV